MTPVGLTGCPNPTTKSLRSCNCSVAFVSFSLHLEFEHQLLPLLHFHRDLAREFGGRGSDRLDALVTHEFGEAGIGVTWMPALRPTTSPSKWKLEPLPKCPYCIGLPEVL